MNLLRSLASSALLLAPLPQSAAPHAHPGQAEHTHPAPPADGVWVYYDYVDDAGRLAGGHLLGQGRRRIAFLGHADEHYPEFADRYRGLCDAMAAQGIALASFTAGALLYLREFRTRAGDPTSASS